MGNNGTQERGNYSQAGNGGIIPRQGMGELSPGSDASTGEGPCRFAATALSNAWSAGSPSPRSTTRSPARPHSTCTVLQQGSMDDIDMGAKGGSKGMGKKGKDGKDHPKQE